MQSMKCLHIIHCDCSPNTFENISCSFLSSGASRAFLCAGLDLSRSACNIRLITVSLVDCSFSSASSDSLISCSNAETETVKRIKLGLKKMSLRRLSQKKIQRYYTRSFSQSVDDWVFEIHDEMSINKVKLLRKIYKLVRIESNCI